MKKSSGTAVILAWLICGCTTCYDVFKDEVTTGISTQELEAPMERAGARFTYYTCEEAEKIPSTPTIACLEPSSIGLYKGLVNDGAYLLGMGSSDVAFQVEIGANSKVVDIRTDYVYTFL